MTIQRFLAAIALVAAGIAALTVSSHRTSAQEPIICFDKEVNKIIPEGQTYRIRSSKDVVFGLGNNTIHGSSGNDTICFADFSDNNTAFGSTGNDTIIIDGADSLNLSGDRSTEARIKIADGGSGNDVILYDFIEKVIGGAGADGIVGFDALVVEGDSGNDVIKVGSFDGLTDVNCGSGRDRLDGTELDQVVSCETGDRP